MKFDGKAINKKLAEKIAGNRNLLRWGNCSTYRKSDGTYFQPPNKNEVHGATPVPCVYLALDQPNTPSEYLILQDHCRGTEARACLNGYRIGGRVKSAVVDSGQMVVSTMKFAAPEPLQMRGRKRRKRVRAMTLKSLGQVQVLSDSANGGLCSTVTVIGADGKTLKETPKTCVMPSTSGSMSCAKLGAEFSAQLLANVKVQSHYLWAVGLVSGGVAGGLIGAFFSGPTPAAPADVIGLGLAGALAGDKVGTYAATPFLDFGFAWTSAAGKALTAICNLVSQTPPTAHPKGPNGTGNHSGNTKPAGCWKCRLEATVQTAPGTCKKVHGILVCTVNAPKTVEVEVCHYDQAGTVTNGICR